MCQIIICLDVETILWPNGSSGEKYSYFPTSFKNAINAVFTPNLLLEPKERSRPADTIGKKKLNNPNKAIWR